MLYAEFVNKLALLYKFFVAFGCIVSRSLPSAAPTSGLH